MQNSVNGFEVLTKRNTRTLCPELDTPQRISEDGYIGD